jgi:prepilin-type N-terminal cleavage/methylation domain-containing protein
MCGMMRKAPRPGYSLLELVIVLSVAGLLVSIALPSLSRGLRTSRAVSASRVIQGDLELAFTYAARQRRPISIAWSSGTMSYTITDRRSGTVYLTRSLGSGSDFTLTNVTFSTTPVFVYPGGVASGPLTVTITEGGSTHTIVMTRAGLVRVS